MNMIEDKKSGLAITVDRNRFGRLEIGIFLGLDGIVLSEDAFIALCMKLPDVVEVWKLKHEEDKS